MNSLVILGCNSFIGRALLNTFNNANNNVLVKAVAREIPEGIERNSIGIKWIKTDYINSSSLTKIFSQGDIVINLTYINDDCRDANIILINKIIDACILSKVSRLVHCSTTSVIGDIENKYINESTLCCPKTPYEKIKMEIEEKVSKASLGGIDVGILRPTAVIGYGSKNLQKLSDSLMYGNQMINYIKRFVMGKMSMHLVPVRNVASALLFLAFLKKKLDKNIFIISSCDDSDNNYIKVEKILLNELGLRVNKFPKIFLPIILQKLLFRVINRHDLVPERIFDSRKIREYGFEPLGNLKEAISDFSISIKKKKF